MTADQTELDAIQRAIDAINRNEPANAQALALLAIYSVLDDLRTEFKRPASRRR